MRVSVVIPAFHRSLQLKTAIEGIRNQIGLGDDSIEIIVVDDASAPRLQTAENNGNITTLRLSQNIGPAGARNIGIDAASGEFIALLDSDDLWLPTKLANQIRLFESLRNIDPFRLVIASAFYLKDRNSYDIEMRVPKEANKFSDFVGGCWVCPGSTIFAHRSVFDRVGKFDQTLRRLEDYDWLLRHGSAGGVLKISSEPDVLVAPSKRPRLEDVYEAVEKIRQKFHQKHSDNTSQINKRRHEAYLELELGVAALLNRQVFPSLKHLAKSFMILPRLQAQTQIFSERTSYIPNDVIEKFDNMELARRGDEAKSEV